MYKRQSQWFQPILEADKKNAEQINIILVQSNDINAFVAGGANIFFYTGLIEQTDHPGELIGVMAHELGHIAGGHLIRSRKALEQASYESLLSTILGLGAAVATGESGAAATLSTGGNSMAQRRFLAKTRVFESSADQAALSYLEKAGLNPTGLLTFLQKLEGEELVPQSQQSEYIRTHPLTRNRIDTIANAVQSSRFADTPYPVQWIEQHKRMKAKLLGFIRPEQVAWSYDDTDKSIPALYARTVADYRLNNIDKALAGINQLISLESTNPYFHELKGQMLVDFGRIKEAIPSYKTAVNFIPQDALIRTALAHAIIENSGKNKTALKLSLIHI